MSDSVILPPLFKLTSTGAVQTWQIGVAELDEPSVARITTEYGLVNGKKQIAVEFITAGKNIGRSNETTSYEQAVAEAQSQWEKKQKKSYVQNIEDAMEKKVDTNFITGGVDPMLAKAFDKDGHKISFPAYVQPKLDGHRCIAIIQDGKCTLWSRTRKVITGVPHIARALESMFPNTTMILDGELYNHDYKDRFEELTSYIRQVTPKPGHEVVQYWVYDVVDMNAQFSRRALALNNVSVVATMAHVLTTVCVVPTEMVADVDTMQAIFQTYLDYGFEGLMVRNANGRYVGKRSVDLQKVKVFADAEYIVRDVEEGRGKMAGRALFVCDAGNGKTFRVKMMGALDNLTTMYNERDKYIGKQLTVKFQNLSADGLPRFPVAMRFREDV